MLRPKHNGPASQEEDDIRTPPPPQVQRGHRCVLICVLTCVCLCVCLFVLICSMCVLCVSDRTLTEYESSFRSPLCRIPEEGGAMDGDTPQVRFSWGRGQVMTLTFRDKPSLNVHVVTHTETHTL